MNSCNINLLENSWSATVKLKGGQTLKIWWTAWPMHRGRNDIAEVLSISSDLPRRKINHSNV